jgi:uncharacterized membrane protein YwzB
MSLISNLSNYSPVFDNGTQLHTLNCGVLQSQFSDQVGQYTKIVSIVLIFLVIFEWWALNRVMNGKLSHEQKSMYFGFIMTFIHALILFGVFYLFYWIVLARIDF